MQPTPQGVGYELLIPVVSRFWKDVMVWLGTHAAYDQIEVTVKYEDQTDSQRGRLRSGLAPNRGPLGRAGGTAEGDELDILVALIEAYEREHYPIDQPDPIEAIKFRLEQTGKDFRALIGVIGQRTRVYEVMRGARPLSLNMIRNLHRKLQIPAAVLIQSTRKPARRPSHRSRSKVVRARTSRRRSA